MNILFILIPIIIYVMNEYHQNKIFDCFAKFYKHRKFIMLMVPLVLVYLKPDILKKIMIYFKDIDESSTYHDLDTLMSSYVNIRNQRKYNDRKLNIPSNNSVRNRNFQRNYNNRVQNTIFFLNIDVFLLSLLIFFSIKIFGFFKYFLHLTLLEITLIFIIRAFSLISANNFRN